VIYAIRAVGTQFVKFGFTSEADVRKRIDSMQTGCPHELKAIAFGPGDRELEHKIHWRLRGAGAHHRGEWFIYCEETEKIIWEIRESSKELPESAVQIELRDCDAPGRLGRVLEYARRVAKAA
jgi:hypothetical protein